MTLLEWGALGELIGGIAIIVSLIYVGLQIKQNTDTLKLSTIHNTMEDFADLYLFPAENSEFADIFFRGLQDINTVPAKTRTINSHVGRWSQSRSRVLQINLCL